MEFARPRRGVMLLTALLLALFVVGNAYADSRAISDGNDRPGPLDIRSASHAHDGARVVHTISTFSRWRLGLIGRTTSNLFAVEISTDRDPALERVVLVFSANGRLVAPVIRLPAGTVVGSASASKPNGRTVRVSIPRSLLGNPSGYRWNAHSQYRAAGACSGSCSDRAPNSGRVLHDIAAPTIALTSFPAIPPDVEYDVSFTVSDKGGAGLDSWELQHRPFGTPDWTAVDSGTTSGLKSHHHISAEDNDDEFRVVAVDRHGNESTRVRLVSVPIDDASGLLVYAGTWSHDVTSAGDFLDTLSRTSDQSATMTFQFTGRYVAIVATTGSGGFDPPIVYLDNGFAGSIDPDLPSGHRRIVWSRAFSGAAAHELQLQIVFDPFELDGIIVR